MDFSSKQNNKKFPENPSQQPQPQTGRQGMFQNHVVCAYHGDNIITNFCKSQDCYMPLCPTCIPIHLEMHSNAHTQPEIDVIEKIVAESLKKIDELDGEFQQNIGRLAELQEKNVKSAVFLKEKADIAKKKVLEIIEHYFFTMKQEIDQYCAEQKVLVDKDLLVSAKKIQERAELVKKFSRKLRSKNYIKYVILLLSTGFLQNHNNFFDEVERFSNALAEKQLDVINDESKLYTFNIELVKYSSIRNLELYKYGKLDASELGAGGFNNAFSGFNAAAHSFSPVTPSKDFQAAYGLGMNMDTNLVNNYSPLTNNPITSLANQKQGIPLANPAATSQIVSDSIYAPFLGYSHQLPSGLPSPLISGLVYPQRLSPPMMAQIRQQGLFPEGAIDHKNQSSLQHGNTVFEAQGHHSGVHGFPPGVHGIPSGLEAHGAPAGALGVPVGARGIPSGVYSLSPGVQQGISSGVYSLSPGVQGLPPGVQGLPAGTLGPSQSYQGLTQSFQGLPPVVQGLPHGLQVLPSGVKVLRPSIAINQNGQIRSDSFSLNKRESSGPLERSHVIKGGLGAFTSKPSENHFSGSLAAYERMGLGSATNRVERGEADFFVSHLDFPKQNIMPSQSPLGDPIILKREDTFGQESSKSNSYGDQIQNFASTGTRGLTPKRSRIFESAPSLVMEKKSSHDLNRFGTGHFN